MAVQSYRGSLTAARLPFRIQDFGRTVINPQYDAAFSRQLGDNSGEQLDSNLPQVYYAENVLPSKIGFRSIGYTPEVASPITNGSRVGSRVFKTNSPTNGFPLWFFTDNSPNKELYIYYNGAWSVLLNPSVVDAVGRGGELQNVFPLNGLIHLSFVGTATAPNGGTVWTYDPETPPFVAAQTLIGTPHPVIAYHFANAGYLVSVFFTQVAWSSNTNVYDFTPSLLTGAGFLSVQDLESFPVAVLVLGGAILVGTTKCVAMIAGNNSRYPFTFQTIAGSVGAKVEEATWPYGPSLRYVSDPADSSGCFTISDTSVQKLTLNSCNSVFPEVVDFFDANNLEAVALTDYAITRASGDILGPLMIKTLFGRYVIVVYQQSIPVLGSIFALVFDIQLQRVGKLRFPAGYTVWDMFEWDDRIGFINEFGVVYTVDDRAGVEHVGALFIGKFQHVRSSLITLQAVEFESVKPTDNFTCVDLPTLDGNTFMPPVSMYENVPITGLLRKYNTDTPGVNHTLVCRGKFDLGTINIDYVVEGIR